MSAGIAYVGCTEDVNTSNRNFNNCRLGRFLIGGSDCGGERFPAEVISEVVIKEKNDDHTSVIGQSLW